MFNILIRTSNRPVYFHDCIRSIESQSYDNYRIIVGNDCMDNYPNHCNPVRYPMLKCNGTYLKGARSKMLHFPVNIYLNRLMDEVDGGWVIFLDDDDMFTDSDSLKIINENMVDTLSVLFWRVNVAGRIIPCDDNWAKRPVLRDISGIGFCFHSSFIPLLQYDCYKQSDYRVMSRAYDLLNPIWIDQVLTRTQRDFGVASGNRKDKC